jgi:hypothetical protein
MASPLFERGGGQVKSPLRSGSHSPDIISRSFVVVLKSRIVTHW